MKAITTKFHPSTNSRPARYSATDGDRNRVTISIAESIGDDNPGGNDRNHARAALALCEKMNWEGDLIEGGTKQGCVFVFADSARVTNPTIDKRRASTVDPSDRFSRVVA